MLDRKDAIEVCLRFEGAYEDYPFKDLNWTIMRHKSNNKMFAAICERLGHIWINLKAEPMTGEFWRNVFPAVVPAYHMNKEHWISVILDGTMTDEEIIPLIEDSFFLTLPKNMQKRYKSLQQNR
jgi:predicted DNA-binding protein (MmcQ/YjbR family)